MKTWLKSYYTYTLYVEEGRGKTEHINWNMEYLKDSNHPLEMNTAMSNKNTLDGIRLRSDQPFQEKNIVALRI